MHAYNGLLFLMSCWLFYEFLNGESRHHLPGEEWRWSTTIFISSLIFHGWLLSQA